MVYGLGGVRGKVEGKGRELMKVSLGLRGSNWMRRGMLRGMQAWRDTYG